MSRVEQTNPENSLSKPPSRSHQFVKAVRRIWELLKGPIKPDPENVTIRNFDNYGWNPRVLPKGWKFIGRAPEESRARTPRVVDSGRTFPMGYSSGDRLLSQGPRRGLWNLIFLSGAPIQMVDPVDLVPDGTNQKATVANTAVEPVMITAEAVKPVATPEDKIREFWETSVKTKALERFRVKTEIKADPKEIKEILRNVRADGGWGITSKSSTLGEVDVSSVINGNKELARMHKRSLGGTLLAAQRWHIEELYEYIKDGRVSEEILNSDVVWMRRLSGIVLSERTSKSLENSYDKYMLEQERNSEPTELQERRIAA